MASPRLGRLEPIKYGWDALTLSLLPVGSREVGRAVALPDDGLVGYLILCWEKYDPPWSLMVIGGEA